MINVLCNVCAMCLQCLDNLCAIFGQCLCNLGTIRCTMFAWVPVQQHFCNVHYFPQLAVDGFCEYGRDPAGTPSYQILCFRLSFAVYMFFHIGFHALYMKKHTNGEGVSQLQDRIMASTMFQSCMATHQIDWRPLCKSKQTDDKTCSENTAAADSSQILYFFTCSF